MDHSKSHCGRHWRLSHDKRQGSRGRGKEQVPLHILKHATEGKHILYLMGSNTGCGMHFPQAQWKAVHVLSFAAAPPIRLGFKPMPPLQWCFSSAFGAEPPAAREPAIQLFSWLESLARFPAVQRDGLCLPIFQMFKSGVLSRSLQRPTRSSEHAGRDGDKCSGEQKGAQWQGAKGSSSSDLLWKMNEALNFPLRLGSKEKRPSQTLRGPHTCQEAPNPETLNAWPKGRQKHEAHTAQCMWRARKRAGTNWFYYLQVEEGRCPLFSPWPPKACHSFSHFLPLYPVQSFSYLSFPIPAFLRSADLTHQLWYPYLTYTPYRMLMHPLHSPNICSLLTE